ncbi:MAG TPA: Calx-beta domain-containing protein [Pyrinomonadaceae bacterium]|jgi:hypothetical protein
MTPNAPRRTVKLSARLVVITAACALVFCVLGVTAYMQKRVQKLDVPVARPAERVEPKAPRRAVALGDKEEAAADTVVKADDTVHGPLVVGTCDTAGPIEVESTGGTAANVPTAYSTLALAFTAINGGTLHTGAVRIDVCGNTTETGTAGLNQVAGVTSVTIAPAGGAARTISGAIAAGSPLINLNGADNVTIDGLNTGGNSLTLSNTTIGTTAGSGTIRFIADATNNTVTNCSILGSSTSTLATVAGTIIFSTGTTTGNDNNTISNNNIGPAGANLPSKAIMASGSSSSIENDNVQITGNNIFDFFLPGSSLSGINILTGNEGWTISNNKFYQTATRTFTTTALRYAAITLGNSTGSFTVSGNTIGFGAANGTGTTTITGSSNEFRAIDAASVSTTAPATVIQNNIISGINQTSSRASTTTANSAFIAVAMGTTDGLINATGNTVGSLDGSSTIVLNLTSTTASTAPAIGFYNFSFFATTISNNNIGAITIQSTGTTTGFRGILVNTTTGVAATINNNTIGGTNAAGAITDTQVGSYAMYGIQSSLPNLTATGNTIRNMSSASNGASLIVSAGILASGATGANTISQNTIHSLSNASGAAANSVYAISLSLPTATNLIERNFIHSLNVSSTVTGTQIWGISGGATGTATYQNNMIRLGLDAAGNSVTLPSSVIGIRDAAGATNQFYHNTVYIGGTGVLATPTASNSYCFFSDVVTVTRNFQDNIFWNARSNAAGGGVAHIAIRVGGTAANPQGLTSNYNVLHFSGTDGATGVFNGAVVSPLSAWRTATGQDANSIAADPQLIAPNGTAATVDLHIHPTNPTPIESAGLAIGTVTNDFDGQTRAGLTPTDIGADAGNFTALDVSPPLISYTPLANTASTSNRTLTTTITDASGVPTAGAGLPVIYYRKGTSGAFSSTQGAFSGGNYNFTIDYALVSGGSVAAGDTIQYYVVAQDGATPPNVGANPAAGAGGFTANPPAAGTPPTTPNSYTILASISGTFNVGAGGTYATLTAAVADLNSKVLNGPVTLLLTDSAYSAATGETFPLTINANGGSSSTNTVTIKPAAGVNPVVTGSSATAILILNGADWVVVNGLNTSGFAENTAKARNNAKANESPAAAVNNLGFVNTNTGTSSAVIWLQSNGADGATNNTIKDVNAVGNSNTTTLVGVGSGSSTISITSAGTGNNNNTFTGINVSKTQYGIYSGGASAANKNTGNVITQNLINTASPNNVATGGILCNFENGIQITQNDIGNLLKHDGTTGTTGTVFGIALGVVPSNTVTTFTGSDVVNATVTRNKINALTQLNSTGYSSFGIVVNSVTSGTTLVANNVLSQIRSAATASDFSAGIVAGGGTGSTTQVYFNSVSMTGTRGAATFPSYGLAIGSGDPTVDVRDNIFFNTQTSSSTGKMYAIGTGSTTFANLTSNYNDFFVTGTSAFVGQTGGLGTSGTDRATLANWQTATGKDANSISADPLFVSTSDLHVSSASAPVNNVGTPISGITTDFDGDTRDATTPDIGADEIVTVAFNMATYSQNESGEDPATQVTVTRTSGVGAASVNYATSNGTATGGATNCAADYTTAAGTLNFAAGETTKSFTIFVCNDSVYEATETVNLTLSNPTGAVLAAPSTAVFSITNDDVPPTVTVNNISQAEGNTGQTAFTYTLTKTGATQVNATVGYSTGNGPPVTATAGAACGGNADYLTTSGTVTFAPNETEKMVTVQVCGETIYETNEKFNLNLSNPVDAYADGAGGIGTIQNDDAAPTLAINDVSQAEGNGGTTEYTFTVTLTGNSQVDATVDYTTQDGTATAPGDYAATSGTLTLFAGETMKQLTVEVNGDTAFEPTEAFTVHLSNATGGATISDADGTGTITNDDPAPPPPAVVCVDDDFASLSNGDDPPGPCTEIGYDAFSTIQAGVNAVAAAGTVNVAAGTYVEDVTISNAGMKLLGAGANVVTISGAIGGPSATTVQIAASNVTVAGCTITRAGNTVAQWNDPLNTAGIAIQGLSITGALIRDNVLTGNRTAIDINNSGGHTVRNNTIDFNRTGLIFRNQTDRMTVVENFIRDNWTVGVLFLDASGGSNAPVQQATGSAFSNNDISANWYAQIVDRQAGGSIPAPGTTNLKYFRGDWFGTTAPVVTTANSAEPGYAAQIPTAYGGTASAPGGQPDIAGPASANFQYTPFLQSGTDTNVETTPGRGTNGFQGAANVVVVRSNNLQGWAQQHTTCGATSTGSQAFVVGPGTPPAGEGSLQYLIGADGDSFETARSADFNNVRIDALSNLSYATYVVQDGAGGQAPYLLLNIDYTGDNVLDDQIFFEPVYQGAAFFPANPQGPLVVGAWQTWDALNGGWWSLNSVAGATPGTGVKSLAQYLAAQPNARVLNTGTGTGGFRIATGCGAGAWDNFVGDADNLSVGVSSANIRYDFEPLPRLSIDDVTHTEGNAGQTAYTFNVTLSGASDQTVTVDYATADNTASAPSDYTAVPTTQLTFMPGDTLKTVTVQVNGDFTSEPAETFFVNLSNVNANATILDGQGVGTITNDDVAQVGITVSDSFVAERPAGTSTAVFTVKLSAPSTQTVTVDYATADGTATEPADYTALPTTQLTFMPGQTTKTVSVSVNGDGVAEGNETFFVNLSNASGNAFITDGQGQGTITDPTAAGDVLITEFRFRGPTFSAPQGIDGFRDEYVELYNNTGQPITVAAADGSAGWTLAALNSAGTGADVLVTLPAGMVIPARAHVLAVNSDEDTTTRPNGSIVPTGGYSLNAYAVGDAFYVTDVSDTAGVAVFNTATVANFSAATRLDAAGFSGPAGATADLFREGAGLSSPGANDGQYAFVRRLETGLPQDSGDNAADFVFVAPNGGTYGGVQATLGAPGPENCGCYPTNPFADGSPIQRNATIKPALIEPQAASTAPPNRIRDMTPVPNGSQGTLEIRRRFKNATGQPVTRLRFRVVDVTTLNTPNPGGAQADVRWLSSTDMNVTTSLGPLTLRGITIEVPPPQTLGGGLNTSGVVNIPGGMLGPNATIDVRFVLGVETGGRFRFFVNVEGLP